MPPNATPSRVRLPRPLTDAEWAEAERVAGRLHAELHRLIEALPEHARHASGMSRHLNVLRATCQRVVQAVQGFDGSPSILAKLPGVEGLKQVLDGFAAAGADAGDVAAAQSAVASVERLVTLAGGSQSKLIERLSVSRATSSGFSLAAPEHRAALHEAAVRVTGRSCEVSLAIYAFRVAPDDPAVLERGLAKGLIGSLVMPGGMPMVMSSGDTLRIGNDGPKPAAPKGRSGGGGGAMPEEVLRGFTTDPLPLVTSRNRKGKMYQIVDPKVGTEGGLIDVVTALKARHPLMDPATSRPTLDAIWTLVTCPTRRLLLDVYLHADMERLFRPSLDALLWAPDLNVAADDRWVMRLPAGPKLQLLGRGLGAARSELYERHAELSEEFFRHIDWDPDEFVGFRCEVENPVWRAGYSMALEYLGGAGAAE